MINNLPIELQAAIQQGFLEREFKDGLTSTLGFRACADREDIPVGVGETVTKTRHGLKAPTTTPLDPTAMAGFDNGLTPSGWSIEQYTLGMSQYGDSIDLNMVTSKVAIASQFLINAKVNGVQASQSLDRLARNALYNAYLGGNTFVGIASTAKALKVDDIRGFNVSYVNGVATPASVANPVAIVVNGTPYSVTAVTADVTNVSIAFGGKSGVLTLSANLAGTDGDVGKSVSAASAPSLVRANGKASVTALTSADKLTMAQVLDATAILKDNAVPSIDGCYECLLDNTSARQLFADDDFKRLFQGTGKSASEFKDGQVLEILGVRFKATTEAPQSVVSGVKVKNPIVVGAGALIEGDFAALGYSDVPTLDISSKVTVDGVSLITRAPMNRFQDVIAQSWTWIGGFAVPSDVTATQSIIPTATASIYKRAIVLQHGA